MEQAANGKQASADENGAVAGVRNARARQRAIAIGVIGEAAGDRDPLAELKELLRTAGVATAGELTQVRNEPDPDRYLGRGKLDELKAEIKRSGANLVACDDELAPRQERNLEKALDVPVIDRTAIILDIFADHAHSAEGKLQVELAQLEYNLARMRGLWTHRPQRLEGDAHPPGRRPCQGVSRCRHPPRPPGSARRRVPPAPPHVPAARATRESAAPAAGRRPATRRGE